MSSSVSPALPSGDGTRASSDKGPPTHHRHSRARTVKARDPVVRHFHESRFVKNHASLSTHAEWLKQRHLSKISKTSRSRLICKRSNETGLKPLQYDRRRKRNKALSTKDRRRARTATRRATDAGAASNEIALDRTRTERTDACTPVGRGPTVDTATGRRARRATRPRFAVRARNETSGSRRSKSG